MGAMVGAALLFIPALYALAWAWLHRGLRGEPERSLCAENIPVLSTKCEVCTGNGLSGGLVGTKRAQNTDFGGDAPATMAAVATAPVLRSVAWAAEPATAPPAPMFSVLVAARNEAAHLPQLLQALRAQALAPHQFEVLITDDHSTDGTAALVATAAQTSLFGLRLLTLPPGHTGKKAALAAAIAQARAPWVVCTDADCRPGPGWLLAYASLLA
ncbi:MAG: glycosyltransferase, partial [Hymenobacter sp.]